MQEIGYSSIDITIPNCNGYNDEVLSNDEIIYYVNNSADGDDGSSWENAFGGEWAIDDALCELADNGDRGRGAGNQGVFVAVSKDEKGDPAYLKMHTTDDIKKQAVRGFITKNIASGSTVQTDAYKSYREPLSEGYTHEYEVFNPDSEMLKWLHRIIGNRLKPILMKALLFGKLKKGGQGIVDFDGKELIIKDVRPLKK